MALDIVKSTCKAQTWVIRQPLPNEQQSIQGRAIKTALGGCSPQLLWQIGTYKKGYIKERRYGQKLQVKAEAEVIRERTMDFTIGKKSKADGRNIKDLPVLLCDGRPHVNFFPFPTPFRYCNIRDDITFRYRVYSHPLFNVETKNST